MGKRILPVIEIAVTPTVEVARKKLGGRAASGAGVGRVVRVGEGTSLAVGVILFVAEAEHDVLLEGGVVRRIRPDAITPHAGEVSREIQGLADDARVFARLSEGQRVRFEPRGGEMAVGTLTEKCRWGALVKAESGRVVAVGFRRLWPAARVDALS